MNEIIILDIKMKFGDIEDTIHPVILKDDNYMVLVDCGYTGSMPNIEKAFEDINLDCGKLTHIVITHQDHDHMGALHDFKNKYRNIKVISSKTEEPYISGKVKSLRLEQAEKMQAFLPDEQKQFGIQFCNVIKSVKPVNVDIQVQDGDNLNFCGGCTVIETFGHTPGHISLYLDKYKTIIAGDAAVVENGNLAIANPQFTLDMNKAQESLNKIANYGADEIICYHGGVFKTIK